MQRYYVKPYVTYGLRVLNTLPTGVRILCPEGGVTGVLDGWTKSGSDTAMELTAVGDLNDQRVITLASLQMNGNAYVSLGYPVPTNLTIPSTIGGVDLSLYTCLWVSVLSSKRNTYIYAFMANTNQGFGQVYTATYSLVTDSWFLQDCGNAHPAIYGMYGWDDKAATGLVLLLATESGDANNYHIRALQNGTITVNESQKTFTGNNIVMYNGGIVKQADNSLYYTNKGVSGLTLNNITWSEASSGLHWGDDYYYVTTNAPGNLQVVECFGDVRTYTVTTKLEEPILSVYGLDETYENSVYAVTTSGIKVLTLPSVYVGDVSGTWFKVLSGLPPYSAPYHTHAVSSTKGFVVQPNAYVEVDRLKQTTLQSLLTTTYQMATDGGYGVFLTSLGVSFVAPYLESQDQLTFQGKNPLKSIQASIVGSTDAIGSLDLTRIVRFNNIMPLSTVVFTGPGLSVNLGTEWDVSRVGTTVTMKNKGTSAFPPGGVRCTTSGTLTVQASQKGDPYVRTGLVDCSNVYGLNTVVLSTTTGLFFASIGKETKMSDKTLTNIASPSTDVIYGVLSGSGVINAMTGKVMLTSENVAIMPVSTLVCLCASQDDNKFYLFEGDTTKELSAPSNLAVAPNLIVSENSYYGISPTGDKVYSGLLAPYTARVDVTDLTNDVTGFTDLFIYTNRVCVVVPQSSTSIVYSLDIENSEWDVYFTLPTVVSQCEGVSSGLLASNPQGGFLLFSDPVANPSASTSLKGYGANPRMRGLLLWDDAGYGSYTKSTMGDVTTFTTNIQHERGNDYELVTIFSSIPGAVALGTGIAAGLVKPTSAKNRKTRGVLIAVTCLFGLTFFVMLILGLTMDNSNNPVEAGPAKPPDVMIARYGNANRTPVQLSTEPILGENTYWSLFGYSDLDLAVANGGAPVGLSVDEYFALIVGGEKDFPGSAWTATILQGYTVDALKLVASIGWNMILFYLDEGDETLTVDLFDQAIQNCVAAGLRVGIIFSGTAPANFPPISNEGTSGKESVGGWTYALCNNPNVYLVSPRTVATTTPYDKNNILARVERSSLLLVPSLAFPSEFNLFQQQWENRSFGYAVWFSDDADLVDHETLLSPEK